MPQPILKKIDIVKIIKRSIDFYKMSSSNLFQFDMGKKIILIQGDEDQLYRVFINLIKNSEDSLAEKKEKNKEFKGKIEVVINENREYIVIELMDNGIGIKDTKKIMTPYFTTKKDGTGLGLPIVNKIINEHSGEISFKNLNPGVHIKINLPKI
jgi:two-component system nitrogen regulation sensor histidine kinase NtrY